MKVKLSRVEEEALLSLISYFERCTTPLPDFLRWHHERYIHVHKESPLVDYVQALERHADVLTDFFRAFGLPVAISPKHPASDVVHEKASVEVGDYVSGVVIPRDDDPDKSPCTRQGVLMRTDAPTGGWLIRGQLGDYIVRLDVTRVPEANLSPSIRAFANGIRTTVLRQEART